MTPEQTTHLLEIMRNMSASAENIRRTSEVLQRTLEIIIDILKHIRAEQTAAQAALQQVAQQPTPPLIEEDIEELEFEEDIDGPAES